MSTSTTIGEKAAVESASDHDPSAVERRPSVEQETQALIDYSDVVERDGRLFGQTLEAEERMRAREWEIERTRNRWDRGQESDREARCRKTAARVSRERRAAFAKRAASVEPWADPERGDARAELTPETLGVVNREAARIAAVLSGFSRAAISKQVARRVVDGVGIREAVLATYEELRVAPGHAVPIGLVGEVRRREVDIEGEVTTLWKPSHPKIQQVGLLEDETGKIKFTVWKKSQQPRVREGDRVRVRNAARNWFQGCVSVALTGWSDVIVLER